MQFAIGKRVALRALDARSAGGFSGGGLDDSGELLQAVCRGALVDAGVEVSIQSRVYASFQADDGGVAGGRKAPDSPSPRKKPRSHRVAPADPRARNRASPAQAPLDVLALRMQCLSELEAAGRALERFAAWRAPGTPRGPVAHARRVAAGPGSACGH